MHFGMTVIGGIAIVLFVFVVIFLVTRLARGYRRDQRGFPVDPAATGTLGRSAGPDER